MKNLCFGFADFALKKKTTSFSFPTWVDVWHFVTGKSGDTDKALGLWTQAQEEDVQPSDEFLRTLGKFLRAQGREVPFSIPEAASVTVKAKQEPEQRQQRQTKPATQVKSPVSKISKTPATEQVSVELQSLRQALKNKDVDKALEVKEMWV